MSEDECGSEEEHGFASRQFRSGELVPVLGLRVSPLDRVEQDRELRSGKVVVRFEPRNRIVAWFVRTYLRLRLPRKSRARLWLLRKRKNPGVVLRVNPLDFE